MEENFNKSLDIIFSEIKSMRDLIYQQIKDKPLNNVKDFQDAITGTKIYDTLKDFKINGRQFDVDIITEGIKTYIYYDVLLLVQKNQWNWDK